MLKTPQANPTFRALCGRAERALLNADFDAAALFFRRALALKPASESAVGGLLIADFCLRRDEFASQVAELYAAARAIEPKRAKRLALGLIETIEAEESEKSAALDKFLIARDGIEYKEFLALLDSSPSFADLFEKITRSTNIYISRKNDWYDLLERLIENGYLEVAYRFIESASPFVGMDDRARALLVKLQEKEAIAKSAGKA
ncbi:MAG: hypothetical protein LBO72_05510 [Helicobacteraceae bacterium]|jgi:hypothetical protein|nr:hypothetical protein [Helicobacteraceae bacterium]